MGSRYDDRFPAYLLSVDDLSTRGVEFVWEYHLRSDRCLQSVCSHYSRRKET